MLRSLPLLLLGSLLTAQDPTPPAPPAPPVAPAAPAAQQAPEPTPPAAMATIEAKELLAHATWLAAEERGGRLTGSPGQQEAAEYIAKHFAALGLEPLGEEVDGKRTFFQHYGIARTHVAESSRLKVGALDLADGFAVLGGKPVEVKVEGRFTFCGLGRVKGTNIDVAADQSLAGQIAVVAIKGPSGKVKANLPIERKFSMSFSMLQQLGATTKLMAEKGAIAIVFVQLDDPIGLADVLNYIAAYPGKDTLSPRFPGADAGMSGVASMLGGGGDGPPTLVLSVPTSAKVLAEMAIDADALRKFLKGEGERPKAKADVGGGLNLTITHEDDAKASNVCAVLRGSDPKLAAEAIVYSAHMDHVGRRFDGEVFNGADDNASGSAGLLAIASAWAKSKEKPKRSIVFLSVSGEELGLWGSAYYADNPTWAADQIVANINTDMIGRSGPESGPMEVTVTPSHGHKMFSTIVRDAAGFAEQLGCTFTSGDKYYTRSDHYNFAKKGIPVVFFCNGEHEDYHQVTDHAEKLDGAKMERIARLSFWTGWSVANADERPRKLGRQPAWR